MARVLAAHAPGTEVCIFYPADLAADRRREVELTTGNPGAELPRRSRRSDAAALASAYDRDFAHRFNRAHIDVVFEQAKFLGRSFPIPVLSWIGDLQHRALPEYFTRRHRLERDVGFWTQARFRRHVVVSSEAARADLLSFIHKPRAEIHVVPFATRMTTTVTELGIRDVRAKYKLDEPYLFLPNQLWRHKNHGAALRGLAVLAQRGGPRVLALSGPSHDYRHPEYSEELARLVATLGVEQYVRWLGTLPYTDVLHLVAGADALVNPSLFEGWSTTVEEAKSLGTPMALSALSVHVEQAHGRAGFFDPHDPIAIANAIDATVEAGRQDRAGARAEAAAVNLEDQRIYARRLCAALEAAVADHAA